MAWPSWFASSPQALVRAELKTRHPDAVIEDAENLAVCINGRKRARNVTSYDFDMNQKRVETKSAQLKWDATHN